MDIYRIFVLATAIVIALANAAAAEDVYVQSDKAAIMAEANFKSNVVGQVSKGIALEILERGDGWSKVSQNDLKGWINNLLIADHPPIQRAGLFGSGTESIASNSRRRISSFSSAAAARGLSEEDQKSLQGEHPADYKSLEKIVKISKAISKNDIKDGKKYKNRFIKNAGSVN